MIRAGLAALALVPSLLPVAATAGTAESQMLSIWPRDYITRSPVSIEGETLRLTQADPFERHDVVSTDTDPVTGSPVFGKRDPLWFGESTVVEGVQDLSPGLYPFVCSIHPDMYGLLEIIARP